MMLCHFMPLLMPFFKDAATPYAVMFSAILMPCQPCRRHTLAAFATRRAILFDARQPRFRHFIFAAAATPLPHLRDADASAAPAERASF